MRLYYTRRPTNKKKTQSLVIGTCEFIFFFFIGGGAWGADHLLRGDRHDMGSHVNNMAVFYAGKLEMKT